MESDDCFSSISPSCAEISRMRPAMGTLLHISAAAADAATAQQAVESAFVAIHRVECLMSFHDPESELSRINREAVRAPQTVHPWTWAVLRRARRVAEASDGLFDISVAPLLVRTGFLPGAVDEAVQGGNWRDIVLMPDSRVFFSRPTLLDLGGIAKGFAVDRAIHELRRAGCTQAMVNAGGDLRCFGSIYQPIHLRRHEGLAKVAELRCGAIATSAPHAARAAHAERLAQPLGSIFDPRTHTQWKGQSAVMVAAPTCMIADALTKVAALAGPICEPLLARFGARAKWDVDAIVTSVS
jgi:FAD:protein FMN transferase